MNSTNRMSKALAACAAVLALALSAAPALAQQGDEGDSEAERVFKSLNWQEGPGRSAIAGRASIALAQGQAALDAANTSKFLTLTGNLPVPDNYLVLDRDKKWWAVFSFDDIGYVKDDEKIDADALLKELKESDGPSNEERKRLGMDAIYTVGWSTPPHYDPATRQLEWGLRLRDGKSEENLNYTIRLLGRGGVMNATLVTDTESFNQDIASFRQTLKGFQFNAGEKYSEFRPGDKVAEIGLAALVLGGAAAVATKKGWWAAIALFLAKAWKLVAVGGMALAAAIGKLFGRKKDRDNEDGD